MIVFAIAALAFNGWMAWTAFDSLRAKNGYLGWLDYGTAGLVAAGSLSSAIISIKVLAFG